MIRNVLTIKHPKRNNKKVIVVKFVADDEFDERVHSLHLVGK